MNKRKIFTLTVFLSLLLLLFTGCSASYYSFDSDSDLAEFFESVSDLQTTADTIPTEETTEALTDVETVTDETAASEDNTTVAKETTVDTGYTEYHFRKASYLEEHYEKHGIEMGFASAEEYEKAASDVVNNPESLHKTEAEDGDDVYYLEATNEFVIVSGDGYIRTYFLPSRGIDYYNAQ